MVLAQERHAESIVAERARFHLASWVLTNPSHT